MVARGLSRLHLFERHASRFLLRWLPSRAVTAMRMRALVDLRLETTHATFAEVDHIIAVCEWVHEVLRRNGVSPEKITLCRQGTAQRMPPLAGAGDAAVGSGERNRCPVSEFTATRPLRLCFLGRLDPVKGLDLVIRAIRAMPSAPVHLDVYGVAQGEGGHRYQHRLMRLAGGDTRIRFRHPVSPAEHRRGVARIRFARGPFAMVGNGTFGCAGSVRGRSAGAGFQTRGCC